MCKQIKKRNDGHVLNQFCQQRKLLVKLQTGFVEMCHHLVSSITLQSNPNALQIVYFEASSTQQEQD